MPTTVTGVLAANNHDGHTDESKSSATSQNATLFWGSNNSSSYGLEPFFYFSSISIPRGRHIISAYARFVPANSITAEYIPEGITWMENNVSPEPNSGYSNVMNRTYFPSLPTDNSNWQTGVAKTTPSLTRYLQELVLRNDWVENNANTLVRLGVTEPQYTGSQRIIQIRAREHSENTPATFVVQYSSRSVQSLQNRSYPSQTPAIGKPSWYQGYRFKLAQPITVSGLYGGASTFSYLGLWADNSGVPGSVLASGTAQTSYGVTRVEPVVLSANTYYWIGVGSPTNHTNVFGLSSFNKSSMVNNNPSIFSEILPSSGCYQSASSTLGAPSIFTGKTVSTVQRELALGMDYITGDQSQDDVSAPTLAARVTGG